MSGAQGPFRTCKNVINNKVESNTVEINEVEEEWGEPREEAAWACSSARDAAPAARSRSACIPSGVASPVTTNHAAKGSVFVNLRNTGKLKMAHAGHAPPAASERARVRERARERERERESARARACLRESESERESERESESECDRAIAWATPRSTPLLATASQPCERSNTASLGGECRGCAPFLQHGGWRRIK